MSAAARLRAALVGLLRPRAIRRDVVPAQQGSTATIAVIPPPPAALLLEYAPEIDGAPDAGEIVWTWVPYDEGDGRGKDRPVIVIARQNQERVYALRLTSKPRHGDDAFIALGTGPWDAEGRPSWVDIARLYSVHERGLRREATALDEDRFTRIEEALHRRYGWRRR